MEMNLILTTNSTLLSFIVSVCIANFGSDFFSAYILIPCKKKLEKFVYQFFKTELWNYLKMDKTAVGQVGLT